MFNLINYKKIEITSNRLIIIISIYFTTILNISFWRYILNHYDDSLFKTIVIFSLLAIALIAAYTVFFSLLLCPKIGKLLISIFLIISANANYMMYVAGIFIDKDMIRNIFETTTREALDLITGSEILWVFITGVIPSILLFLIKVKYKTFFKELLIRIILLCSALILFLIVVIMGYKDFSAFGRNHNEVRKLFNTFNFTYYTVRHIMIKLKPKPVFQFIDNNPSYIKGKKRKILVLVVGETSRAKNFSLYGYKKDTNPLLEKEDIIFFKRTLSCGTATATSVPCMFSYLKRKNFNVEKSYYQENLLDILKKVGFDVFWLDNDDGCKGVCRRVKTEYTVKTQKKKYCKGNYCQDGVLVDGLEQKLMASKNDMVVILHSMGSHGPTYFNRYPKKFRRFTPTCDTADIQKCTQEELFNTYDNTIVYIDFILKSVIDVLKKFPNTEASMIYISDHGESLGENNMYLHGLPYMIAPIEQRSVPFILWMNKKNPKINYNCMKRASLKVGEYSHDEYFHSIISLLDVKTSVYDSKYDIFKVCKK